MVSIFFSFVFHKVDFNSQMKDLDKYPMINNEFKEPHLDKYPPFY